MLRVYGGIAPRLRSLPYRQRPLFGALFHLAERDLVRIDSREP